MRDDRELLVDCLARLERAAIPYMLTGSMASNYWGVPRSTHDLDVVLRLPITAVDDLLAAFEDAFFIQRQSIESAMRHPHQFNAIDVQSALKVDFWVLRDDPFEQNIFERRIEVTLFGSRASIATAEDLILHKLYWNKLNPSDRQLRDAAGVYSVQGDALDLAHLERWAATLGVSSELHAILSGQITPKST
jgi:hypothetical protein